MSFYNILCVDDKESNLYSLEQLLKNIEGVQVFLAKSGIDALNLLLKKNIDLILLDIQMPEMDGYEVAKLVKSNQLTKDIPIIFVTAVFKSEEFKAKGFEVGAIDYLTKPIDDNQLLNKIKLYIKVLQERDRAIFLQHEYQSMTDSMAEGLFTLNIDGKIDYINHAALEILGFKVKDVFGKKMHDLIHYKNRFEEPLSEKECNILNVFNTRVVYIGEEIFVKSSGDSIVALISAAPIIERGKILKVSVLFQDITKRIEQEGRLLELERDKSENYENFISSLVTIIEKRDTYTAGHNERVAKYSIMLAKHLGFSDEEIKLLESAARLHDIGKISTPDSILLKPSKLTSLEYELIKDHLKSGYEILSSITNYKEIAEIMKYHHERYDGLGYPYGLKGDEIPLMSHVMIVADAFDAMTTDRIYKSKKSVQQALKEIEDNSSKQFHPVVAKVAIEVFSTIDKIVCERQLPKTLIELHRFSYFFKDKLTDLFLVEHQNLVEELFLRSKNPHRKMVKLLNFNEYNRQNGWQKGDELLINFSNFLKSLFDTAIIFRIEGDDFLIVSDYELDIDKEMLTNCKLLQNTTVKVEVE